MSRPRCTADLASTWLWLGRECLLDQGPPLVRSVSLRSLSQRRVELGLFVA